MRVLLTGAGGFVGQHILPMLREKKWDVLATSHADLDILNLLSIRKVVKDFQPNAIVHLAAQSQVGISWDLPILTAEVNILGSVNLYTEFAKENPNGKFLYVGSSDVYGITARKNRLLIEEMPCLPQNPYAITKLAAEQMLLQMAHKYKTRVICTRSFNHYGPGQNRGFVVSDFASQLAEIKLGYRDPIIKVGNLSAEREFIYVDDVARAYMTLLLKEIPSGIYNVATGRTTKIKRILEMLINISSTKVAVNLDENKMRPVDVKSFCGSNHKLSRLGWKEKIQLQNGLANTFDYWLRRCAKEYDEGKLKKGI